MFIEEITCTRMNLKMIIKFIALLRLMCGWLREREGEKRAEKR